MGRRRSSLGLALGALCVIGLATTLLAVGVGFGRSHPVGGDLGAPPTDVGSLSDDVPAAPHGTVTLAFAGDVHFELYLAALLDHPRGALGPIAKALAAADVTMVNLESAIADGGSPDPKELEVPSRRFWFRTSAKALDVLAAAGVDVVTVANNHGADYGAAGLSETLRARRVGPVAVVGVGRDRQDAFTPKRFQVRGTTVSFLAADASRLESSRSVWAAGPRTPGLAAAHADRPRALLAAVRAASVRRDVVVVYLHWGEEGRRCPTVQQRKIAQALASAGADVVLGSHAHVLLGSGWLGDTYVNYGLGNFLWYSDAEPDTGVLRLTLRDGRVVSDSWTPARIETWALPSPLSGRARAAAIAGWHRLRGCAGLAPRHGGGAALPSYSWAESRIGPALQRRMRYSYSAGCPVPLADLRYLQLSYVGFDGLPHTGELVVHRAYATQVSTVFRGLYEVGWPIRRMRLVDDYRGDDARSMAANNTSGFNCRTVAGSTSWSAHAYGAAIDVNPVQNPDLSGGTVAPLAGRRFANVDRAGADQPERGVVTADGPVLRAFAGIGWEWGGTWSSGRDYQHFSAPTTPHLSQPRG